MCFLHNSAGSQDDSRPCIVLHQSYVSTLVAMHWNTGLDSDTIPVFPCVAFMGQIK